MKLYEPPTKEFFRLPNKLFQVPLDATQFKLYSYFVCCSGSKGYCWPTMETIIRETGIKKSSLQKAIKALVNRKLIAVYKHNNPYLAVLNMQENSRVLTPALESVIGSKIALTEDRISQLLFKLTVEIAVQNHLTAGRYRYEDGYLDGLRDYCVQEVKALNGRMDLKEIQKAYEG